MRARRLRDGKKGSVFRGEIDLSFWGTWGNVFHRLELLIARKRTIGVEGFA